MLSGGGEGGGIEDVAIQDFVFAPDDIIIKPGTTVRWTNTGAFTHTSTRTSTWDSGFLSTNQTFDFAFTSANAGLAYDYLCDLHPFMTGFVRVARFGDANVDGNVNINDFTTLAGHFGQQTGGTWETGDFNGDGNINVNDFTLLAANFGLPIQPAGSIMISFGSSVPEPAGAAVLLALLPLRQRANTRKFHRFAGARS